MNIGVYLGSMSPEEGGGHTFERDIFQALQRRSSESRHALTVFTWAAGQFDRFAAPQFKIVSLARPFFDKAGRKIASLASALLKKIRHPSAPFHVVTRFDWLLASHDIHLLWSLNPETLSMEIPYIVTVWDLQHRFQPFFPEASVQGEWAKRERKFAATLRRAAYIVSATRDGRDEIERFYQIPSERIKILPYPTPRFALEFAPASASDVAQKYHLPEKYLFYPAQFWPHKNHVGILHALDRLRREHQLDLPVVFVGADKGNLLHVKRAAQALHVEDLTYFLGFIPQADLAALYHHALALVFMTFFGPGNLPPLEAFALECPVIASDVTGAAEQIGDAGILVDPKDDLQLALAIKSLHDDPQRRATLIQRGKRRASAWTSDNVVNGMMSLFDDFAAIRRCWGSYPERS